MEMITPKEDISRKYMCSTLMIPDGEVTRSLRRSVPYLIWAIIVISKDIRLDTQLYAYSKRIDDYMEDPVPLPLLEAHIEAILRRFSEKKLSVETSGRDHD